MPTTLHPLFNHYSRSVNPLDNLPQDFLNFLLTTLFALLIGLEQRRHHEQEKLRYLFGTDRTFALIGILGFVLYHFDKEHLLFFGAGGLVLCLLLAIAYAGKILKEEQFGMTSVLIALITYCLAPLIYTQPPWLVLLILITVLILTEIKEGLIAFSEKFDKNEFITLAKFIAIAGVILPLTPREQVIPGLDLTPYRFWLAVVAVSAISYASYLLKKFVFPEAGLFLTGVLGGLYSSTATTFSLAGKTKTADYPPALTAAAILIATAMMFLRILALAFLFNAALGRKLLLPFLVLSLISAAASAYLYFQNSSKEGREDRQPTESQPNPLEFRTALLFALLFVFFAALTHYVLKFYGSSGVSVLSFIVGVTDIDPFLLNLFQGKQAIPEHLAVMATIQATISNNFLKAVYGAFMGRKAIRQFLWLGFGAVIAASFVILLLI
ncbi:MAG: DUF4010 domain-containing protein [Phaeodactylibacter sp.]|nr:DUF4010 domain-containing protein [Phaeodactylibacter sp.]MCB9264240.1 DUF4010 domain-containing protein [Lewinellaceae bacterium]MCB9291242.1 DUF4010 domain-containing protein [Lewinellaceae bacterium]